MTELSKESQTSSPSPERIKDIPACAAWGVWLGPEIEGHDSLGEKTLFIRRLNPTLPISHYFQWRLKGVNRVWFTKEFLNWNTIREFARVYEKICLETNKHTYNGIPSDLRKRARLYYKLEPSVRLKDGDHICVGAAFRDESFLIGSGNAVIPEYYNRDEFIE